MAKKSRRANRNSGSSLTSSQQSSSSNNNTMRTMVSVDREGRMAERDGRRFYALLSALAVICLPHFERERKEAHPENYKPLNWNEDISMNSMDHRLLVCNYILRKIDQISSEIDAGKHDHTFRAVLGRRITADEKSTVRAWKVHVEDDFYVIRHLPNKGALFVQVGLMDYQVKQFEEENQLGLPNRATTSADIHEPRCFIVRGLADPLEHMLTPSCQMFAQNYPSVVERFPDLRIGTTRGTLIPYMDGITYMGGVLTAASFERFKTRKDEIEAIHMAVACSKLALRQGSNAAEHDDGVLPPDKLYSCFDANVDAGISRRASDPVNDNFHRVINSNSSARTAAAAAGVGGDEKTTTTALCVQQFFWNPTMTVSDPQYKTYCEKVTSGDRPFCLEGYKSQSLSHQMVKDDDPCPFHKRFGQQENANKSFVQCGCKAVYEKRKQKADAKNRATQALVVFDPFEKCDQDAINRDAIENTPTGTLNLGKWIRLGHWELAGVEITIPVSSVATIKERMDDCFLFHAVLPYKWIYLGWMTVPYPRQGIMTFGDVELDPKTGVFRGDALSAGRLQCLIKEMKYKCCDMPILAAKLEAQPSHKVKPNVEALQRNHALLKEGWENENVDVKLVIDKETNASIGKSCGYCGEKEHEKLNRCACKSTYYCSKDCQRKHWKDHKAKCNRLRGITQK